jgi:hypothetical protein
MSGLIEIEAAVDRLPYPEQEILLKHLARKLGVVQLVTEGLRTQRERRPQTPVSTVDSQFRKRSLQETLDGIRTEDC